MLLFKNSPGSSLQAPTTGARMASRFFRWFYGLKSETTRFLIAAMITAVGWILADLWGKGPASAYLLTMLILDHRYHNQQKK